MTTNTKSKAQLLLQGRRVVGVDDDLSNVLVLMLDDKSRVEIEAHTVYIGNGMTMPQLRFKQETAASDEHYVFIDMSGSMVNKDLSSMCDLASSFGVAKCFGFNDKVFAFDPVNRTPLQCIGGTNLRCISEFLASLKMPPGRVTVITDDCYIKEDVDPSWTILELK